MIDRPGVVSWLAELPEANDQVEGSQDRWRNRDTRNDEQWPVQGGFGVSACRNSSSGGVYRTAHKGSPQ